MVVAVAAAASLSWAPSPAAAHGERIDVTVEAVTPRGERPGRVEYGIALVFSDGDPLEGATVTVSVPGSEPTRAEETTPGIYIGGLQLAPGDNRVTVAFSAEEGDGSVHFTHHIAEDSPLVPIVMVDTAHPERVGTTVTTRSGILSADEEPEPTVAGTAALVVEALVGDEFAPLSVTYTVAVSEGVSEGAVATVTAVADDGTPLEPVALAAAGPGLFQGTVTYPRAERWEVNVAVGGIEAHFVERLPWPHFSTEAGKHKVKVDSRDPNRAGTFVADSQSVFVERDRGARSPDSDVVVPRPDTDARAGSAPTQVIVDLPDPARQLSLDIGLRIAHLFAIALWVLPLTAHVLDRRSRRLGLILVSGLGLTGITGFLLALFGAPVDYPGLFDWNELSGRYYGPSYQTAFIVKMTSVAAAVVLSVLALRRTTPRRALTALVPLAVAALAVTAMSQFHLFSHL